MEEKNLSKRSLSRDELELLETALRSKAKTINIRLREGEYQFELAKTIALFELKLSFPDVKDLIKKLYGEEKAEDIRFVRKIQTILKKMEKSGITKILPKKKPWELQRYAVSSFKFQDVEKNLVLLATETEVKETRDLIRSLPHKEHASISRPNHTRARILLLIFVAIVSYTTVLWTLTQPKIDLFIFVFAYCIATICSILLGMTISRRK